MKQFRFHSCGNCHFRYPTLAHEEQTTCPYCHTDAIHSEPIYDGHTIETTAPQSNASQAPVAALLDNLRSAYNVGSIFRTAEAANITPLHLCGMTATPDNPKVSKTALGTDPNVPWQYHLNGALAALSLKQQGYQLWAIEGGSQAQNLFNTPPPPVDTPILLIVGNERAGVDPDILALCDRVLAIPMYGNKGSLNVTVAFGIAAYWVQTNK